MSTPSENAVQKAHRAYQLWEKIDIKQEFGGDLSVCMLSILSKASTLATLLAINLTKVEI